VRPLSWLVEKFWPVKGWTEEDLAKLKANTFKFKDVSQEPKPAESEPFDSEPKGSSLRVERPVVSEAADFPLSGVIYSAT
jgi:hypothetical protein